MLGAQKHKKLSESLNGDSTYEWTLSDKLKSKAWNELHENDNIRQQALIQFREWIEKHPRIKKCRTDARFLLRFLRARKFNIQRSSEMLEKYLSMYQLYPKWFKNLDINDEYMEKIMRMGFLLPLPKRDEHGRKLIYICIKNFDGKLYTSVEAIRIFCLLAELLIDDEESQINGFVFVFHEQFTLEFISSFTINDIKSISNCFQHAIPMRQKEFHLTNIPIFAKFFIDLILSTFSEKLQKRFVMHSNVEEFKKNVDITLLPKEYGGTIPFQDIMDDFIMQLKRHRDAILDIENLYIEVSRTEMEENMDIGSFRKLEVD